MTFATPEHVIVFSKCTSLSVCIRTESNHLLGSTKCYVHLRLPLYGFRWAWMFCFWSILPTTWVYIEGTSSSLTCFCQAGLQTATCDWWKNIIPFSCHIGVHLWNIIPLLLLVRANVLSEDGTSCWKIKGTGKRKWEGGLGGEGKRQGREGRGRWRGKWDIGEGRGGGKRKGRRNEGWWHMGESIVLELWKLCVNVHVCAGRQHKFSHQQVDDMA